MKEAIFISGLGERHPIKDSKQIIWFLDAYKKTKSKCFATRLLLDIYFDNFARLKETESYELINYLHKNLTDKQIKNRIKWIEEKERKNKEWMKGWEEWKRKRDKRYAHVSMLLSNFSLN